MNGSKLNITHRIAMAGLRDFLRQPGAFLTNTTTDTTWWLTWITKEHEGECYGIEFKINSLDDKFSMTIDGNGMLMLARMVTQAILWQPANETDEFKQKLECLRSSEDASREGPVHDFDIWIGRRADKIWIALIKEGMPNIRFETDNPQDDWS